MNLESTVLQVHVEDIIPNRFQPRLNFDEEGLKELSDSIKEHGIIQPLVLRKLGNKYEIIAGERRYKAAQMAGLTTVPAVIANIDDNKSAEVALVENVQRRDLTAIEEAEALLTGETVFKGEPIPFGKFIIVVLSIIQNSKGEFLIQKRSKK